LGATRPTDIEKNLIVMPPPLRYRFRYPRKRHDRGAFILDARTEEGMSAMHHQPDGPAFDIVLLLHVGCVVVGLVTTATAAATATRLRRLLGSPLPLPEPLRRYFRPGVNWAGRTVYGIPVFGFALIAMSQGAYALGDGWVLGGLTIFAALALVEEGVLWPSEHRLQVALAADDAEAPESRVFLRHDATSMSRAAGGAVVLLVAGTVLMVAQP
jgi:uncharacterized membrane protein